jgi:hypothetical protein
LVSIVDGLEDLSCFLVELGFQQKVPHHIGNDKYSLKGSVFLVLFILSEHVFEELIAVVEELIYDKLLFISLYVLLLLYAHSILDHQLG